MVMRLFVTTYQKSGTHQIMPALGIDPDIVDRSRTQLCDLPPRYGRIDEPNRSGMLETCGALAIFEDKAFGHVAYLPEYAKAIQAEPTKVIFNIRDPRDIVVSEWYSANQNKWPNLNIEEYNKTISDLADPIAELIELAACRWPRWLGWLDHDFVLPVKYEDLRLNGKETMEKIAEWLEPFYIHAPSCADKLQPRKRNPTFRRGVPGEWKDVFTDKHKELSKRYLSDIIERLGYEL